VQHRRHRRVEHRALATRQRTRVARQLAVAQQLFDELVAEPLAQLSEMRRLLRTVPQEEKLW